MTELAVRPLGEQQPWPGDTQPGTLLRVETADGVRQWAFTVTRHGVASWISETGEDLTCNHGSSYATPDRRRIVRFLQVITPDELPGPRWQS